MEYRYVTKYRCAYLVITISENTVYIYYYYIQIFFITVASILYFIFTNKKFLKVWLNEYFVNQIDILFYFI